jgi:hypothetical protein
MAFLKPADRRLARRFELDFNDMSSKTPRVIAALKFVWKDLTAKAAMVWVANQAMDKGYSLDYTQGKDKVCLPLRIAIDEQIDA